MLYLMKSLLGIIGMVVLKDLIRHGGGDDLSLLKGEKEALILVMIITIRMPLVKHTSITLIVKHIDY
jgi:hypothetical protein